MVHMQLPADGTGLGTYTLNGKAFVYAAQSVTVAAGTATASTVSLTHTTSGFTITTPTQTFATAPSTQYLSLIGVT